MEQTDMMVMENSTKVALREIQDVFSGEAERVGLETEDDVVDMVKQFSKEKLERQR